MPSTPRNTQRHHQRPATPSSHFSGHGFVHHPMSEFRVLRQPRDKKAVEAQKAAELLIETAWFDRIDILPLHQRPVTILFPAPAQPGPDGGDSSTPPPVLTPQPPIEESIMDDEEVPPQQSSFPFPPQSPRLPVPIPHPSQMVSMVSHQQLFSCVPTPRVHHLPPSCPLPQQNAAYFQRQIGRDVPMRSVQERLSFRQDPRSESEIRREFYDTHLGVSNTRESFDSAPHFSPNPFPLPSSSSMPRHLQEGRLDAALPSSMMMASSSTDQNGGQQSEGPRKRGRPRKPAGAEKGPYTIDPVKAAERKRKREEAAALKRQRECGEPSQKVAYLTIPPSPVQLCSPTISGGGFKSSRESSNSTTEPNSGVDERLAAPQPAAPPAVPAAPDAQRPMNSLDAFAEIAEEFDRENPVETEKEGVPELFVAGEEEMFGEEEAAEHDQFVIQQWKNPAFVEEDRVEEGMRVREVEELGMQVEILEEQVLEEQVVEEQIMEEKEEAEPDMEDARLEGPAAKEAIVEKANVKENEMEVEMLGEQEMDDQEEEDPRLEEGTVEESKEAESDKEDARLEEATVEGQMEKEPTVEEEDENRMVEPKADERKDEESTVADVEEPMMEEPNVEERNVEERKDEEQKKDEEKLDEQKDEEPEVEEERMEQEESEEVVEEAAVETQVQGSAGCNEEKNIPPTKIEVEYGDFPLRKCIAFFHVESPYVVRNNLTMEGITEIFGLLGEVTLDEFSFECEEQVVENIMMILKAVEVQRKKSKNFSIKARRLIWKAELNGNMNGFMNVLRMFDPNISMEISFEKGQFSQEKLHPDDFMQSLARIEQWNNMKAVQISSGIAARLDNFKMVDVVQLRLAEFDPLDLEDFILCFRNKATSRTPSPCFLLEMDVEIELDLLGSPGEWQLANTSTAILEEVHFFSFASSVPSSPLHLVCRISEKRVEGKVVTVDSSRSVASYFD